MKTIGEEIKIVASLVPQTLTTNNTSTSGETVIDTMGYDNACFVIMAGNGTFVDETYSFQVFESATNDSTSGAALTGAVAAITADNQVKKIQVSGLGVGSRLRYMWVRLTAAGSNESLPCTAFAILAGCTGALNPVQENTVSV